MHDTQNSSPQWNQIRAHRDPLLPLSFQSANRSSSGSCQRVRTRPRSRRDPLPLLTLGQRSARYFARIEECRRKTRGPIYGTAVTLVASGKS